MNDFKIKKADIIIVFILLVISILPLFAFASESYENKDRYAVISVNTRKYTEVKLGEDLFYEFEIDEIDGESGHSIIQINGYEVHVKESNCRDQICVKQGIISKVGQSIVCLPNRVLIEITGKEPAEIDDISR